MAEEAPKQPDSSTTTAQFALPIGGATLRGTVQLPAGRTTLTQLLPIIQDIENTIVDRVTLEAQAANRPISCRAGCGACCRQLVPLTFFEAEALTEWLQSLPQDRLALLHQRFQLALSALRDAGIMERMLDASWMSDEKISTRLNLDYFHAGVPCPFLENESCSIHPIRPLICREYLVTSSPELCKDPAVHAIAGLQFPVRLSRALVAFGRHIDQDDRGWLPLVFLLAWGRSGAKPGGHVTGTGPDLLKRFLDEVQAESELAEKEA
jgi:Fe-S-cluster containining protein